VFSLLTLGFADLFLLKKKKLGKRKRLFWCTPFILAGFVLLSLKVYLGLTHTLFNSFPDDIQFLLLGRELADERGVDVLRAYENVHKPLIMMLFALLLKSAGIGISIISIRLLSPMMDILSAYFLYLIGCKLFSRRVGLVGAFLLTLNSVWWYFGHHILSDVPSIAIALGAFYFLLKGMENVGWKGLRYYILAGTCAGISILFTYAQLPLLFLPLLLVLPFSTSEKNKKSFFVKSGIYILLSVLIPLIGTGIFILWIHGFKLSEISLMKIIAYNQHVMHSVIFHRGEWLFYFKELFWSLTILPFFLAGYGIYSVLEEWKKDLRGEKILPLIYFLLFFVSLTLRLCIMGEQRYVLSLLPIACLYVAIAVEKIADYDPKKGVLILVLALLSGFYMPHKLHPYTPINFKEGDFKVQCDAIRAYYIDKKFAMEEEVVMNTILTALININSMPHHIYFTFTNERIRDIVYIYTGVKPMYAGALSELVVENGDILVWAGKEKGVILPEIKYFQPIVKTTVGKGKMIVGVYIAKI